MQKIVCLALVCLVAAGAESRIVTEDFSDDPRRRGWEVFGASDLLRWSSENQNLEVTWDSSRPNHYLRLPLETILRRNDDFSVSLELVLHDIAAGVNSAKRGTFQIAFGFQNAADAAGPNFQRAASGKSPNLVEFNFLPDTGFGPTVWPAMFTTNGGMNYSGPSDFCVFELPIDSLMQISLAYASSNETATITVTTNGSLVGPVTAARLATNDVGFGKTFTQFKLDAFAIASYSDAGYNGSVLAHGIIDNIRLTVPAPAIRDLSGQFVSNVWQVTFVSQTGWNYWLQSTTNFANWNSLIGATGNGARVTLEDSTSGAASFFEFKLSASSDAQRTRHHRVERRQRQRPGPA